MAKDELRAHLIELLEGRGAHMSVDEAVAAFPLDEINRCPPNVSYSPWQLLEHVRITQWDILDYLTNPSYQERPWPEAYWPGAAAQATAEQWNATLAGFRADQASLRALILDPARDPFAVLPNTPRHTLAREIRIVADHNAYHIGEFAILRQVMGTWPANREE